MYRTVCHGIINTVVVCAYRCQILGGGSQHSYPRIFEVFFFSLSFRGSRVLEPSSDCFILITYDLNLGDPKLINILPLPSELFHGQSESSADIEFMNEICKVENQNGYRVQE